MYNNYKGIRSMMFKAQHDMSNTHLCLLHRFYLFIFVLSIYLTIVYSQPTNALAVEMQCYLSRQ